MKNSSTKSITSMYWFIYNYIKHCIVLLLVSIDMYTLDYTHVLLIKYKHTALIKVLLFLVIIVILFILKSSYYKIAIRDMNFKSIIAWGTVLLFGCEIITRQYPNIYPSFAYFILCIAEEFVCRVMLIELLSDTQGGDIHGLLLATLVFGTGHIYHRNIPLVIGSVVLALITGYWYVKYKHIIGPIVFHFLIGTLFIPSTK